MKNNVIVLEIHPWSVFQRHWPSSEKTLKHNHIIMDDSGLMVLNYPWTLRGSLDEPRYVPSAVRQLWYDFTTVILQHTTLLASVSFPYQWYMIWSINLQLYIHFQIYNLTDTSGNLSLSLIYPYPSKQWRLTVFVCFFHQRALTHSSTPQNIHFLIIQSKYFLINTAV